MIPIPVSFNCVLLFQVNKKWGRPASPENRNYNFRVIEEIYKCPDYRRSLSSELRLVECLRVSSYRAQHLRTCMFLVNEISNKVKDRAQLNCVHVFVECADILFWISVDGPLGSLVLPSPLMKCHSSSSPPRQESFSAQDTHRLITMCSAAYYLRRQESVSLHHAHP